MSTRRLRIVVVAPSRHALRQPHAGGLEACVWERVRGLRARGHHVTLCGPAGSDFLTGPAEFTLPRPVWTDRGRASDTGYPDGYLDEVARSLDRAMAVIARHRDDIDVVDNHSLHGTPVEWSGRIGVPMMTTLHTPPLPAILAAERAAGGDHRFLAVSGHTAREWAGVGVSSKVFPNGVDTARWAAGRGGDRFVWFGRIVPEKAPHLAIDAALAAGRRVVLAGRVGDAAYFEAEVRPRLGGDATYVGPLHQRALARLVGGSAVALVTPTWDEPFGLVIAEAMATGTPVAAFDAGGVSEVTGGSPGAAVVPQGDVAALAAAALELAERSRPGTRLRARTRADAIARHSLTRRHAELEVMMLALAGDTRRAVTPVRRGARARRSGSMVSQT